MSARISPRLHDPRRAFSWVAAILVVVLLACATSGWCEEVPLVNDAAPLTLAAGADYWSTRYALGATGVSELNPLGQTEPARLALKASTALATTIVVRKLRARGRRGEGRAFKYLAVAAQVAVAGWNVRNARRAR